GQDWLVLTDPGVDLTDYYEQVQSIDVVTVSVKGAGSVEACLTLDGATCHGQIRGVTLNGASSPTVIGTGASGDTWGDNLWTYDMNARRNKLFGVMLRATQGAAGPVTIQYASLSLNLSEIAGMPTSGSFRTCSPAKSNGG